MRALWIVFGKEFIENLRDRRTLFSALVFGPLFGPILFGALVTRMLEQNTLQSDQPLHLTISGSARVPGLVQFLTSQGVVLKRVEYAESDARTAVQNGEPAFILLVPAEYPERFKQGKPAPLLLVADSSDSQSRKDIERTRALLNAYGSSIAQRRLAMRGVDPLLVLPVAVNDVDVTTPAGRAVVVLGFMTYFILFAVLMGGLYLAIDTTAGERERGSLEALLSLPVARSSIVGGKILATSAYMCISLAISLAAFVCVFRFVPLERLGMSANLGVGTALEFFGICLPFVPLGAALMSFVASFARSYREGQTYLTTLLLVPTLPIALASIYSLKTKSSLMVVPSLSQHLLMTSVLKAQPVAAGDVWVSAGASLGLAALFTVLTARLWRRETLLG